MTTNKKKAAPKRKAKPKKDDFITVQTTNYGNSYMASAYDSLINTMYGVKIPDTLEGQVTFWKKKFEDEEIRSNKLSSQVTLLKEIINNAMNKSCNCDQ